MLNEADIREREGACGLGGGRIKGVVGSGWGSHQGGTGIWGGGGGGGSCASHVLILLPCRSGHSSQIDN